MLSAATVELVPRISEKTFAQSKDLNVYVFNVPSQANKMDVKAAVEKQFRVTVTKVNVVVAKGKVKRSVQKRKQPTDGIRKDAKKAYVTLKKGDSIPVFEEGS